MSSYLMIKETVITNKSENCLKKYVQIRIKIKSRKLQEK